MGNFVIRLKTPEGTLEFSFMSLKKEDGIRYHVSTVDKEMEAYRFKMLLKEDKWIIQDATGLPLWIQQLEEVLSEAIIHYN